MICTWNGLDFGGELDAYSVPYSIDRLRDSRSTSIKWQGVDTEARTVQVCSASERASADGDPELQGGVDGGKQVSVPEGGLVAWMTGSME